MQQVVVFIHVLLMFIATLTLKHAIMNDIL